MEGLSGPGATRRVPGRLRTAALILLVSLGAVSQLARVSPALAAGPTVYSVIGSADVNTGACLPAPATCDSLRDAVAAANADSPGTSGNISIVLSQTNATYSLSSSLTLGNIDGQNITVCAGGQTIPTPSTACTAAGANIVEIHETTANNIFVTGTSNNLSFTFQNLKFTNGVDSTGSGGGALSMGANHNEDVTVNNCTFTNNSAPVGGGGGAIKFKTGHNLTISNSTFQNNTAMQAVAISAAATGGAVLFSDSNALSITGSIFTGNSAGISSGGTASDGAPGQGGAIDMGSSVSGATMSIATSTFTNNTAYDGTTQNGGGSSYAAAGQGGAIAVGGSPAPSGGVNPVTITTSIFSGNTAGTSSTSMGEGGAIFNVTGASTSVTSSTFTTNSAEAGYGGAAFNASSSLLDINFNRIVGNTATNGSGVYNFPAGNYPSGTTDATKDWWGCNGGPGATGGPTPAGCDAQGNTTYSPWIVLTVSASPGSVVLGGTSNITADFLHDSNGGAIAVANIPELVGATVGGQTFSSLGVTWGATNGAISNNDTAINSSGKAQATFTQNGTTCSAGTATATVDNGTGTANITTLCPDLKLAKGNDVSGSTTFNTGWNWTLTVSNTGPVDATFASGQTILQDDLPNSGLTYGTVTWPSASMTGITGAGNISCAINGSQTLTCSASGGSVTIANTSGAFKVVIPVTPTAANPSGYVNPRSGGICRVNPGPSPILESDTTNNDCTANTVAVAKANVTVGLGTSGSPALYGSQVTFTATVSPVGTAIQPSGSVTFTDTTTSTTLCSNVTLTLVATQMQATCQTSSLAHGSHSITVHYNGDTNFNSGDPVASLPQVITGPHLELAKTNNVTGSVTYPTGWTWTLTASNVGDGAATFTTGQTILQDDLPSSGLTYGSVSVPAGSQSGISGTGSISCAINGSQTLTCTASGGTVTIGASNGAFAVLIPVTPSLGGVYANPRAAGKCQIDPAGVIAESDTTGNSCSDSVTVNGGPSISASPVTAPGTSTTITWKTGDGSVGQVWVKVDGGAESLFGQGASGTGSAPWIMAGHTYTFSLYAGTSHTPPALTSKDVTATIPAHFISASPNPVTVGHTTDISWSTGSTSPGQVWVSMNGRPEALVATGPYGTLFIPWILPGHAYVFKLYSGTSHTGPATDSVTVRSGTASIVAGTNPVSGGGTTTLDWSTGDGSAGTVCVAVNGGTQAAVPGGAGADGMVTSGAIATTDVDLFTLHTGAGCSGTVLTSTRVTGTAAPFIAANPTPVVNSSSSTISWNTGNSSIGQVWVAEDGATEVLVIQGVSGSVSIPWLQAGHSYVFTLYAGTSHTPGSGTPLASVTVTPFNFPSISATPNPVTSGNSTTVSWDTGESSTGEVWVSVNGGAETLVARNPKGSISPSWIQPGVIYTFTLYQGTGHSVALAQVNVTHS